MAQKLKFRKVNENFQNRIKETLRDINKSKEVIVSRDKSPILFKIPVPMYLKLLREEVTKNYEISSKFEVTKVSQESLELIKKT